MHRVFDYVLPYRQKNYLCSRKSCYKCTEFSSTFCHIDKKTTLAVEKSVTNAQSFRVNLKCYLGFGSESKLVLVTKVFYFVFSVVWKLRVGDIGNVCPLGFE